MADTPLLLAGLGNPGDDYARHRHNVGFMAVDTIAGRFPFGPAQSRFEGLLMQGEIGGRKTLILKPQTYMNESGRAVAAAARFWKIPPAGIVVFHDELDLAPGKIKLKMGGGDAGHNGLRSISAAIGPDYRRVRIGIGHPGSTDRVHAYVLHAFAKAESNWLAPLLDAMAEAAPRLAEDDDAGFMSSVALATIKQRPHMPKAAKE